MKRIYLDSNVLIAYHSLDKAEEVKKTMVADSPWLRVRRHSSDNQPRYSHVGGNRDGEAF